MYYPGHTSNSPKTKILLSLKPGGVLIDRRGAKQKDDDACGVRTHALSN
jgi:hypothetical protein